MMVENIQGSENALTVVLSAEFNKVMFPDRKYTFENMINDIIGGLSNQDIADKVGLSRNDVLRTRKNILKEFGTVSVTDFIFDFKGKGVDVKASPEQIENVRALDARQKEILDFIERGYTRVDIEKFIKNPSGLREAEMQTLYDAIGANGVFQAGLLCVAAELASAEHS